MKWTRLQRNSDVASAQVIAISQNLDATLSADMHTSLSQTSNCAACATWADVIRSRVITDCRALAGYVESDLISGCGAPKSPQFKLLSPKKCVE